jgi:hypothetical protein
MPPDKNVAPESGLKPFAVSVKTARRLLGDKSHSGIYLDIAAGKLEAVKDGSKTLIVLESIERRVASLPRAKIGGGR